MQVEGKTFKQVVPLQKAQAIVKLYSRATSPVTKPDKDGPFSWGNMRDGVISVLEQAIADGGIIYVKHHKGAHGFGRFTPTPFYSLGNMPNEVRAVLCDGLYLDIDMVNSGPRILAYFFKLVGLPIPELLSMWLEDRDRCMAAFGVEKRELTIIANCSSYTHRGKNAQFSHLSQLFHTAIFGGDEDNEDGGPSLVSRLSDHPSFNPIWKYVHSQEFDEKKLDRSMGSKRMREDSNKVGSFIANCIFFVERLILEDSIQISYVSDRVSALIHDGFLVYSPPNNPFNDVSQLIDDLGRVANTRFPGIGMSFKVKEFVLCPKFAMQISNAREYGAEESAAMRVEAINEQNDRILEEKESKEVDPLYKPGVSYTARKVQFEEFCCYVEDDNRYYLKRPARNLYIAYGKMALLERFQDVYYTIQVTENDEDDDGMEVEGGEKKRRKRKKERPFIKKWLSDGSKRRYHSSQIVPPPLRAPPGVFNTWLPFYGETLRYKYEYSTGHMSNDAPKESLPKQLATPKPGETDLQFCERAVEMFKCLVWHLAGKKDKDYAHFLSWLGDMIQNPGSDKPTMVCCSGEQGVGKTMICLLMRAIVGRSKTILTDNPSATVLNEKNASALNYFVGMNEMTQKDAANELLKSFISDGFINLRLMHTDTQVDVTCYHRVMATSNYRLVFDGRRFILYWADSGLRPEVDFFDALGDFCNNDLAIWAIYDFLNTRNLTEFKKNPTHKSVYHKETLLEAVKDDPLFMLINCLTNASMHREDPESCKQQLSPFFQGDEFQSVVDKLTSDRFEFQPKSLVECLKRVTGDVRYNLKTIVDAINSFAVKFVEHGNVVPTLVEKHGRTYYLKINELRLILPKLDEEEEN